MVSECQFSVKRRSVITNKQVTLEVAVKPSIVERDFELSGVLKLEYERVELKRRLFSSIELLHDAVVDEAHQADVRVFFDITDATPDIERETRNNLLDFVAIPQKWGHSCEQVCGVSCLHFQHKPSDKKLLCVAVRC